MCVIPFVLFIYSYHGWKKSTYLQCSPYLFLVLLVKEVVRATVTVTAVNSDFLLGITLSQRLNTFVHVHVEFLKIVNNDKHIGVVFLNSCSNLSLNMNVS